jgi:CubicO group peptidase (beta-lactamase class C family)
VLAGNANDVPVTENSRFRIASLSKSFTSLAVPQLVDAGRMSLEDPVVAYLPEFRLADPRGADITVRQLLDQTSGLADREVPDFSRPKPGTLAEATTSLRSAHLVAAPGTQFNYHNPTGPPPARGRSAGLATSCRARGAARVQSGAVSTRSLAI